jgi:hypothetical protein
MVLIQVVPMLPPAIDGLGDYALNLARQLRLDFEVNTHFVVGTPTWEGENSIEGFPISILPKRSGEALSSLLLDIGSSPTLVLLHYVSYGYALRGCPVWLVQGLQHWRTTGNNRILATMFHEVYASGPPWASSFWLSPLQKNIAARLAQLSDRIFTNRQGYAKTLYELSRGKHKDIPTLPVFSNIGEPEQIPPLLTERQRRLVIFGHRNVRMQVYQEYTTILEQICQALDITEIYDIGVSTNLKLTPIKGIPIVEKGVTKAAEIGEILLDAIASFATFPPADYLAKSTVFAAYCAHRLIPIMASSTTATVDGLQAGKHYWVADEKSQTLNLEVGQAIAEHAYAWYQTHNLSVQAQIFAAHLHLNP